MVLMAEANQHGWAQDYIGFGYFVGKVVCVLECGATPWVLAGVATLGLPQSKASRTCTCLWERFVPSFLCSWMMVK